MVTRASRRIAQAGAGYQPVARNDLRPHPQGPAAGGDLYTYCRHRMKRRGREARGGSAKIPGRVSIHDRPQGADGSTFGDFEMDTIISARSRAVILTLVER